MLVSLTKHIKELTMTTTIALSGNNSILSADFNPPIYLENNQYEIGLTDFETFMTIPNIEEGVNNKFYYDDDDKEITIPTGSYEFEDLAKLLTKQVKDLSGTQLNLTVDKYTLKSTIKCLQKIIFLKQGTIREVLGFNKTVLSKGQTHESDNIVKILRVNSICIDCNICTNSYLNGKPVHIIHQFFPSIEKGYKIVGIPTSNIFSSQCPDDNQYYHKSTGSRRKTIKF